MARIVVIAGFVLLIAFFGVQFFNFQKQEDLLHVRITEAEAHADALETENEQLTADIDYFSHPANLVKELKSKFNYKRVGERLIIVPNE